MSNVPKTTLLAVAVVFAIAVLMWLTPRQVDWTPSYRGEDKIPLGSYILHDLLVPLTKGEVAYTAGRPVEVILRDTEAETYLIINNQFDPTEWDAKALLDWVAEGHTAFIAAEEWGKTFSDTLGLEAKWLPPPFFAKEEELRLSFTGKARAEATVEPRFSARHFTDIQAEGAQVLAINSDSFAVMLAVPWGEGQLLLSSTPDLFTNYLLLEQNTLPFVAQALAWLPSGPLIWDDYYKAGRIATGSELRYVMSQVPLRMSLYLLLAMAILFILFRGKRRQRIIPVLLPHRNASLQLVDALTNLSYRSNSHGNIARQKIQHFLQYVWNTFKLKPEEEHFLERLQAKSGVPQQELQELFQRVEWVQKQPEASSELLLELNEHIDNFYQKTAR